MDEVETQRGKSGDDEAYDGVKVTEKGCSR